MTHLEERFPSRSINTITELRSDVDYLKKENTELKDKVTFLQGEITDLQVQMTNLKAKVEALEQQQPSTTVITEEYINAEAESTTAMDMEPNADMESTTGMEPTTTMEQNHLPAENEVPVVAQEDNNQFIAFNLQGATGSEKQRLRINKQLVRENLVKPMILKKLYMVS